MTAMSVTLPPLPPDTGPTWALDRDSRVLFMRIDAAVTERARPEAEALRRALRAWRLRYARGKRLELTMSLAAGHGAIVLDYELHLLRGGAP